jgi:hypothetical protein
MQVCVYHAMLADATIRCDELIEPFGKRMSEEGNPAESHVRTYPYSNTAACPTNSKSTTFPNLSIVSNAAS